MTEVILMLPLFLFVALIGLQMAHIGLALIIANYGASSVARKAVQQDSPNSLDQQKVQSLMVAGLKVRDLLGCTEIQAPVSNLEVRLRVDVPSWPFIGIFFAPALKDNYSISGAGGCTAVGFADDHGIGPVNFSNENGAYFFTVNGKSKVRMNYRP